ITDAIEFNTVDGFQGQEKEVIIFSCVRAGDAGVGFLADRRRMNVGLTRARKSMFVLGNAKKLSVSPIWNELVSDSRARGLVAETRLPLFGRAVRRGIVFDCLLTEDVRSAQVADGEGDRAEFTLEEVDEAELSRFNEAMARQVARVTNVVGFDAPDANVTAGTRKPAEQRMHPALKSVEDARKREAVLEARKRSRSCDTQSREASSVDASSGGDRTKRLKQSTDEPHVVSRAGVLAADRPKKSSCLFIQRKRPGRGGRTGSVDRVRTHVVHGGHGSVALGVRDTSVVRERDRSPNKDRSLSRDQSSYNDRSQSRDQSQSRDRSQSRDQSQNRDRSLYGDRSQSRNPSLSRDRSQSKNQSQ
ncbi:DEAD-box type RNA helicase, partial [Coemansia sp. RSA 678]